MRLLVCGGRNYGEGRTDIAADQRWVFHLAMQGIGPHVVITGDAHGADRLARNWANSNRIPLETYAADWGKHGRAAGPIRNAVMIAEGKPDRVIAFPGGNGTRDCIRRAKDAGIHVLEISK